MADSADDREEQGGEGGAGGGEGGGGGGGGGEGSERDAGGGLTDAQTEVLEKCLHALKHAKNDSHTLAALLLVSVSQQRCSLLPQILSINIVSISAVCM